MTPDTSAPVVADEHESSDGSRRRGSTDDSNSAGGEVTPSSLAKIYILVGRNAQSQSPPSTVVEKMRKRIARKAPAFSKHWAIRITWANGDDKVWQIFQANKEVLSPVCSDYAMVRRHFATCHSVGRTSKGVDEISSLAIAVRNDKKTYHLIIVNCQTFALELIELIKGKSTHDLDRENLHVSNMRKGLSGQPVAFGAFTLVVLLAAWSTTWLYVVIVASLRTLGRLAPSLITKFAERDLLLTAYITMPIRLSMGTRIVWLLSADNRFWHKKTALRLGIGTLIVRNDTLLSWSFTVLSYSLPLWILALLIECLSHEDLGLYRMTIVYAGLAVGSLVDWAMFSLIMDNIFGLYQHQPSSHAQSAHPRTERDTDHHSRDGARQRGCVGTIHCALDESPKRAVQDRCSSNSKQSLLEHADGPSAAIRSLIPKSSHKHFHRNGDTLGDTAVENLETEKPMKTRWELHQSVDGRAIIEDDTLKHGQPLGTQGQASFVVRRRLRQRQRQRAIILDTVGESLATEQ